MRDTGRGASLPRARRRVARDAHRGRGSASARPMKKSLDRPPRPALDPDVRRHRDRRRAAPTASTATSPPCSSSRARRRCLVGATGEVPVLHGAVLTARSAARPSGRIAASTRGSTGRIGYYPLAIRLNQRHGFHRERMQPGSPELDARPDRESARSRAGTRSSGAWNAGTSRPARMCRAALRERDARRLQRDSCCSNVQPQRRPVPRGSASPRPPDRRACRELGSHGRQGRDLALSATSTSSRTATMRGRSAPLPRHRAASASWSRAGRRPTSSSAAATRADYDALVRSYGLDPARPARRSSWGTRRRTRRTRVASSSASSAGGRRRAARRISFCSGRIRATGLARALRRGARESGRARAGGELHGPRRCSRRSSSTATRRRERGHDPARRARQRPTGRVRALRRGRTRRRELGDEERHRRALSRSSPPRVRSTPRRALRGCRRGHRARPREPRRAAPRNAAASSPRSSARSTGMRRRARRRTRVLAAVRWSHAMKLGHDAPRAQRGRHRRRADRVSPERRRRLRRRDRQPLGGRHAPRSSSATSAPDTST